MYTTDAINGSIPIFNRVRVAQSLSFRVMSCRSLFVLICLFSFGHYIIYPSIYGS